MSIRAWYSLGEICQALFARALSFALTQQLLKHDIINDALGHPLPIVSPTNHPHIPWRHNKMRMKPVETGRKTLANLVCPSTGAWWCVSSQQGANATTVG